MSALHHSKRLNIAVPVWLVGGLFIKRSALYNLAWSKSKANIAKERSWTGDWGLALVSAWQGPVIPFIARAS